MALLDWTGLDWVVYLLVCDELPVSFLPDLIVDGLRDVETGSNTVALK